MESEGMAICYDVQFFDMVSWISIMSFVISGRKTMCLRLILPGSCAALGSRGGLWLWIMAMDYGYGLWLWIMAMSARTFDQAMALPVLLVVYV
jgi:hypothetical protein